MGRSHFLASYCCILANPAEPPNTAKIGEILRRQIPVSQLDGGLELGILLRRTSYGMYQSVSRHDRQSDRGTVQVSDAR